MLKFTEEKLDVEVYYTNRPHNIFIPYKSDEMRRLGVGGYYWKDGKDPMLGVLQNCIEAPCHNCQCYQKELELLRKQLGIVEDYVARDG